MNDKKIALRIFKNSLIKYCIMLFAFLPLIPLVLILFYISEKGIAAINWDFFTKLPTAVGEEGGGILNALIGTGILIGLASLLAIPIGIGAGIYLSENRKGKLSDFIRLASEVLTGVPSIVIGVIAYIWVVVPMGNFSAFSGGIALALMMFPLVIKATEETLKLIPHTLKEASIALGVPYHRTILKVILPAGFSGILTGALLGVARIAGETAPLLFTAFGNPFLNFDILKPVHSLPLLIFNYAASPYSEWHTIAWGASFVLIAFVLLLNIFSKWVLLRK